ncbi:MAG: DUF3365 domain-containing protein [Nitrospirae bacterium]|nr:DUF3365 domain-containing protein [Nitrospirota bacterium]
MENIKQLRRYTIAAIVLWTVIVGISLSWEIINEYRQTIELATNEARANFNKDQAIRFWAARHGGIYVPPDERTPPNPALSHIPDRDIVSNFGKKYTLMNPAYMLRQLMQEYGELYGIKGRITSLKLLNPLNAPDEWELKALMAFERGVKEVLEISEIEGKQYLRLMRPMLIQEQCLKCHAYQNYKVGDVRGGVGVSVPMTTHYESQNKVVNVMLFSHGVFWLLGLMSIGFAFTRGKRRIIERTRADEELRESQRKFSSITSVLGEGVYMLDKDNNLSFMNPEAERLLGWQEEELVGKNMHEMIHYQKGDGSRVHKEECPVERVVNSGNGIWVEDDVFTRKNGDMFPVSYVSTPVIEEGRVVASVTAFQDITERKRTANELIKKSKELEELNITLKDRIREEVERNRLKDHLMFEQSRQVAMGELLINIAHQWRQPLNVIGILVQNVRDAYIYKELSDELLDSSTNTIMGELLKLSGTITAFTDIYNKETDKTEFSVQQAINRGLDFIENHLVSNNIKLETDIIDDILVEGYPNIIIQLIIAVITNSLDVFRERKIEKGCIKIKAMKNSEGNKVTLSMSDNGGGIEGEIIDRIFDPYFTTRFKTRGKGMSLYLIKAMIERRMEGTMSVRNTKEGAEFIVELSCLGI